MSSLLTESACLRCAREEKVLEPQLQLIQIKTVKSGTEERTRLAVSDGKYTLPGLYQGYSAQELLENGIKENSVVRLKEFRVQAMGANHFLVITEAELVQHIPQVVGQPTPLTSQIISDPSITTTSVSASRPANSSQQRVYANAPKSYSSGPIEKIPQGLHAADESNFIPIRALNPYGNRWTIKCRVTSKSQIRTWDKGPTNQGKLFSIDMIDSEDSDIRATFFRDAVDLFYDVLQVGNLYTFSNGQVKIANKRFNTTNCDYELTFGNQAEIQEVKFDDRSIKTFTLSPTKIKFVSPESTALVDVLGVLLSWTNIETFTSKAGREITKLEITLVDDSMESIRATIFGEKCYEFETQVDAYNAQMGISGQEKKLNEHQPASAIIVGLKSVRVSDFEGCSLSLQQASSVFVNPDLDDAMKLKQWVSRGLNLSMVTSKTKGRTGGGQQGGSSYDRKEISEIGDMSDHENISTKGVYVTVQGCVTFMKRETMYYPACPEEGNNKKCILQPDGQYYCEATGQVYPAPEWRYICNAKVTDDSGSQWVTMFNESAEKVIGYSANELHDIRESNNEFFETIINKSYFKEFLIRLRVKEETYNDEPRMRYTAVDVTPLDYEDECRRLLETLSV